MCGLQILILGGIGCKSDATGDCKSDATGVAAELLMVAGLVGKKGSKKGTNNGKGYVL